MTTWERRDPPRPRTRGRYDALRDAAKADPGAWLAVRMAAGTVHEIRRQRGPWKGFEVTVRTEKGTQTTFVRYVGD